MIRFAERIEAIAPHCEASPFGCQILSAAKAYGFQRPFAQFWADNGAAYGLLDGVMRVSGRVEDAEEARAFLKAVGAQRVICDEKNAVLLAPEPEMRGVILQKALYGGEAAGGEVSLRALYEVLRENGMASEFEPFYLDLSHRVRHGTARCAALYRGEEMTAAAAALLGGKEALITAVAVRPAFHRRGLGREIMGEIEARLGTRTAYVLRAEHENEAFYASLGYTPCGVWCSGILK
ncbi:MAG: GNAT family N-acetyltransferase [Hominenteromicrobium sp.]